MDNIELKRHPDPQIETIFDPFGLAESIAEYQVSDVGPGNILSPEAEGRIREVADIFRQARIRKSHLMGSSSAHQCVELRQTL